MRGRLFLIVLVVMLFGFGLCANLSDTHGSLYDRATNGDHTKYAPGFSEAAFEKVRPGMDRDAVRQLLGEPLRRTGCFESTNGCGATEEKQSVWEYTAFNGVEHGWGHGRVMRDVVFLAGKVLGTDRYYEPDPQ